MKTFRFRSKSFALTAALSLVSFAPAFAALPEGANSLNETYQDWVVACVSDGENNQCSMIQNQVERDSGQRMMTVELSLGENGELQGILLLPFGLALAEGVTVSIDDQANKSEFGFSTCLPQGCVAPVKMDASMIDAFKTGEKMNIEAAAVNTNERIDLGASLRGFTAAYNRLKSVALD